MTAVQDTDPGATGVVEAIQRCLPLSISLRVGRFPAASSGAIPVFAYLQNISFLSWTFDGLPTSELANHIPNEGKYSVCTAGLYLVDACPV